MRKDVGHKVRWFGNDLGQRGTGDVSPCHRKTIEAAEHFVFAVPEARDGPSAGDVGLHTTRRNLGYRDFSHSSTKRPQGSGFGVKTHTHGLFIGNVLGGERG